MFLEDTNNKKIKNKIYFFHCQAEIIDEIFPGIMGEINKRKLTNTVFVTEKNKNLEELNSKYNLEELFNNIVLEKEQKNLEKNKKTI